MKTSVIGGGTWGTALAIVLAVNGHEVTIWSALERERKALTEAPDQIRNLPGARLPKSVRITGELNEACSNRDLIVFAVASP